VSLDGAYGTHLSTSLSDLEKLNIDQVVVGANGLTINLGDGNLDGVSANLPSFSDGGVTTIALDNAGQLQDANGGDLNVAALTGDVNALASAGVDQISIEQFSDKGFNSIFGADKGIVIGSVNATGDGVNGGELGNLVSAIQAHDHTDPTHHVNLSISDAEAQTLLSDGLTFATTDGHSDVSLDGAYGTHLSTSLSDLEKLNIDQVVVGNAGLEMNVGGSTLDADITALLKQDQIHFTNGGVHFNLDLQQTDLNEIDEIQGVNQNLVNELIDLNVNRITLHESLDLSTDWMSIQKISDIYTASTNKIATHLEVSGNKTGSINFNQSLNEDLTGFGTAEEHDALASMVSHGIDLLHNYTDPANYGDLINALSASGVTDFVVDSGNVQITDDLAAALVNAGMLQALPAANLAIDATGELNGIKNAYLATSLKSMADLGVHSVAVDSGANEIYLDLGIAANDPTAVADMHAILTALDPSNGAKLIHAADDPNTGTATDPSHVALVLTADEYNNLGGAKAFDKSILELLHNIGVTEVDVLDSTAQISSVVQPAPQLGSAATPSSTPDPHQPAPVLPEVKIIGTDSSQFHDLADHHAPTTKH
jgi:hypothetical protein